MPEIAKTPDMKIRYVVAAPVSTLVEHAARGRRVIVAGPVARHRWIFDRMLSEVGPCSWSRANGSIEIESGGAIFFVSSSPDAVRGVFADTLCVLAPVTEQRIEVLMPCIRTSERPIVYREL
ncbi:hypothetical protein BJD58_gp10 [Gordonia phage UmaThurman]|uniref:hypothetical protein n=1 Tax=Gordonia phage UmaThurman TaxID=1821563 RepID=UPI00078D3112|nr:hypothetical protein BJD58_gp10 [Gordonia phage UmaThurman]AMS03910.1 hypothetical protein SEA_UMATHURMAN_10 [Gordonia phage UmaThurman]QDK02224.1 hypothetical protein SEA_SAMBA_10 [Gordonia phage Samba]